jgi:glycosyltransferase involved in cell wall biosynthesis
MRVSFLDQYGSLGGGQQVLLELIRAAHGLGMKVTAVVPGHGGLLPMVEKMGGAVRSIPELRLTQGKKGSADALRLAGYSAALIARHGAFLAEQDLVYVNGARLLPAMMALSFVLRKVRFCYHIHLAHANTERRLFGLALSRPNTTAVVVPSTFVKKDLVQFSAKFSSPKVQLVENGLSQRFDCLPFEDRFGGNTLARVALIGRLSPEKGQDILTSLAPILPDISFHVLGDSAFADDGWSEGLRRTVPANVHFHGWVDDVPSMIRELGIQVCLVPSRCDEASGLVPLEGMALSCLTVVRSRGGLAEIAARTGALTFGEDAEVAPLLSRLAALSAQDLSSLALSQHTATLARYGHEAFVTRLRVLLKKLVN